MHALTGCNSVSAFSGKGKGKAFKLMMKKERYVKALVNLGSSWELSDEPSKNTEEFVGELYGNKSNDVDLLRYDIYCAKGVRYMLSQRHCHQLLFTEIAYF